MSDSFDDKKWGDAVRGLNEPPAVPRDKMWQAIDDARRDKRQERPQVLAMPTVAQSRGRFSGAWRIVAGLAAVLVIGVAVGRMTVTPNAPMIAEEVTEDVPSGNHTVRKKINRLATVDLFGRADFLLTDFKVQSCAQQATSPSPAWAAGMLLQTRLLMDTSVGSDPEMKKLLDELELVLAQIVGLSRENCAQDMAWIQKGLQENSTLERLRLVSDDGPRRAL
ncbi:MAG: hypothetical protein ACI9UK_000643 [Candidatus Krumholzibacteriia bacterium]|jgi:hypothetical protein